MQKCARTAEISTKVAEGGYFLCSPCIMIGDVLNFVGSISAVDHLRCFLFYFFLQI